VPPAHLRGHLAACTGAGLVRRIEPAGHPARFERRTGDNHHHVAGRLCRCTEDVDCATTARSDAGIPVASDEHSLTVGPDGPILLQDHYLIEQMAQFNRERIPERQPHAKGGGAFGRFEVTNDVSA
jgi:hypothetical protein